MNITEVRLTEADWFLLRLETLLPAFKQVRKCLFAYNFKTPTMGEEDWTFDTTLKTLILPEALVLVS